MGVVKGVFLTDGGRRGEEVVGGGRRGREVVGGLRRGRLVRLSHCPLKVLHFSLLFQLKHNLMQMIL